MLHVPSRNSLGTPTGLGGATTLGRSECLDTAADREAVSLAARIPLNRPRIRGSTANTPSVASTAATHPRGDQAQPRGDPVRRS